MRPAQSAVWMPANPMQTVRPAEGAVWMPERLQTVRPAEGAVWMPERLQTVRPAEGAVWMPVKVLLLLATHLRLVPTRSRLPSILIIICTQVFQVFREISRNVPAVNRVGPDIPHSEIGRKAAALCNLIDIMEDG